MSDSDGRARRLEPAIWMEGAGVLGSGGFVAGAELGLNTRRPCEVALRRSAAGAGPNLLAAAVELGA